MAAVYDWTVPFSLVTPQGTLPINQLASIGSTALGYFMLEGESCNSGAEMRVSRDDMPQSSGEIAHLHYKSGYEMRLKVQLWETIGEGAQPAWHDTLVKMSDLLQLHLNAIVGQDSFLPKDGRVYWTPDSTPQRMLNPVRLLERPAFTQDGALTSVTFAVMSDRPYAWDAAEIDTAIPNTTPTTLTNTGTASFYPVIEVYGPTTFFELKNNTYLDPNGVPAKIRYDFSLPGAISIPSGHYVELDFWRNTAYLDGNSTNCKPGIDVRVSDFWPIVPGANVIEIDGATALVKWQAAWA